ncbi:MAG: Gfo/Idh/MocA family oxidoreductase [Candidatus Eisenbacteria bacterium]
MSAPIAVGLAGAGPWATHALAPMLAAGPETMLAAVWSRTPATAAALAATHGVVAVESFAALLERCEAVAFAVPPGVQAELAPLATRAGRHLLLDKPLAFDVAAAERVVEACERAGVVTQLMLTHRYREATAAYLASVRAAGPVAARLECLSGAFVRGPYACAWRREYGVLHDLGPHAFDLLEAALGPIVRIRGSGDPRRTVALACEHESGAPSAVMLSGVAERPATRFVLGCDVPGGTLEFDAVAASAEPPWPAVRRSFARAVREGVPAAHDARRGLALQRLIGRAGEAFESH